MAVFGGLVSHLPQELVQPAISFGLGIGNLATFIILVGRARESGPEQRGWRLLTLSFLGVMTSNVVLLFTPSPLIWLSPAELIYFGLQLFIAFMQAWALLSWPLRATARTMQRVMNLLGCLIFGGSLFLLVGTLALFQELNHGPSPVYIRMMGLALRVALVGGVTSYILADDPRRVRGPIGWFFAAAVGIVTIIVLVRPYLYDQNALLQPSPLFGIVLLGPLTFAAAAWFRSPVEVPPGEPRLRFPMVDGLLYLPFVAVGAMLIVSALHHQDHLLLPLLGFMGISGLLLARQFLLVRVVRSANERLEERVQDRTRSLEELQKIMLRTERLNSIGVLGAGLTHDLNNALMGIRGSTELARLRLEEGQATTACDLDRILVAADQSATLTGRLMAFARQEEDALGPLDLAGEVSNLEGILRMMLTRNISLKFELGEQPVLVQGSKTQVEQILVNLVGNAKDAMPEGGFIRLKLWTEPHTLPPTACLEVSDTGEGIAADILAKIFDPFFTTKTLGKGTGLGLASVKHLMEDAGGSIQVESEPDHGSRFILRFLLIA
jgi:signal transduction histidine kinase